MSDETPTTARVLLIDDETLLLAQLKVHGPLFVEIIVISSP